MRGFGAGWDSPTYRDVRDVFERAEAAAREERSDVSADHLVLGILRAADPTGATVLRALGIGEADLVRGGAPLGRDSRSRWGPVLQPIIQIAADEARRLGSRLTRSAHVLLGVAASGQGTLAGLLAARGVALDDLRARVREAIAASPASSPAGEPMSPAAAATTPSRELFTVDQAAEFLGIHHQTLRGYIKTGKLPAYRLAGEKVLRIKRDDLIALLEPVAVGDVSDEG
jgi:excisionase family DNA binding protein